MRRLGREVGIDMVLENNGIDLVAAPGDSSLCVLAAAAGKFFQPCLRDLPDKVKDIHC
jgi:hypothetical protein